MRVDLIIFWKITEVVGFVCTSALPFGLARVCHDSNFNDSDNKKILRSTMMLMSKQLLLLLLLHHLLALH
jgi:hypothetical protein